jgi:hypothetical protein
MPAVTSDKQISMKLEVSDVDRAERFYGGLGWRLDADFIVGDAFRGVQFTPPDSPCSIHFGKGITSAVPGSVRGLYLVVSNIESRPVNRCQHERRWDAWGAKLRRPSADFRTGRFSNEYR